MHTAPEAAALQSLYLAKLELVARPGGVWGADRERMGKRITACVAVSRQMFIVCGTPSSSAVHLLVTVLTGVELGASRAGGHRAHRPQLSSGRVYLAALSPRPPRAAGSTTTWPPRVVLHQAHSRGRGSR